MASITAFEVGYCTHPACIALKGAGFKSRCFPSRAYLLQTSRGLHLWDTGYANHFMDATRGIYRLYPLVTPIYLNEHESIILQLREKGIHPKDLRSIVVSHFHADHIAGLLDFPGVPIVCAASGWQSVQNLHGIRALRRAFLPALIPQDMPERITFMHTLARKSLPSSLAPFQYGWDLDGSGEIYLVDLPGHAIGHIGAFVQMDSSWSLLASDAAWAKENYTELRGPMALSFLIQDSRTHYYDTLRKLSHLHANGVTILLTHQETGNDS